MKSKSACVWYSWSTDTTGKALAEKLKEQFDVETVFIDVPTGM